MSDSTSQPSQVFPAAARWRLLGTVLVALQALVLVGLAVAWLVGLVRGTATYPAAVVGLAVVALVAAWVLALAARAIHRAASWPRAPVITFQLLLGVMGAEWVRGEALAVGVAAVVVALVITVALLVPGVLAPRRLPGRDEA